MHELSGSGVMNTSTLNLKNKDLNNSGLRQVGLLKIKDSSPTNTFSQSYTAVTVRPAQSILIGPFQSKTTVVGGNTTTQWRASTASINSSRSSTWSKTLVQVTILAWEYSFKIFLATFKVKKSLIVGIPLSIAI